MKRALGIALVMALPLQGCVLWHDFVQPQTATPEHWAGAEGRQGAWPDRQWWKQFKSEALTAQVEEAEQSNFDIGAAVARVRQADAQVRIIGAPLLPGIDASGGASRQRIGSGGATVSSLRQRIVNSYDAGLSASYELDFWGKNWAGYQSAKALADASRYDQETVRLTTLASVATNYFDILGTRERLNVAQQNVSNAEALLTTIRKRVKVGIATALDLAQQENVVATQRASIPPLEQHLQQAIDAQALLLGKLPETVAEPKEKLKDIALPSITAGLPSQLLERRPDVQAAEAQLASAHADIIAARAAFFPSISLTGSGGYQSAALANLFRSGSYVWSGAASLAQPIFEGGLLMGQLELQKARYDELLANYRKAVVASFTDVEDALSAAKQTAAGDEAQEVAVKTARQAYKLTLQQLESGIIDITTVLNTQRTLFAAEDAKVQSKLQHLQALVGLYRALGGGWDVKPQPETPPGSPGPEPLLKGPAVD